MIEATFSTSGLIAKSDDDGGVDQQLEATKKHLVAMVAFAEWVKPARMHERPSFMEYLRP